jgi:pyruvate-formate lyase-activating enzyme
MSMNGVTSTWGPQGLVADPSLSAEMVSAARRWFAGELRLNELREVASTLPQRSHISMVVNNECNLNCTHCFLQLPSLARQRLTPDEWHRVLETSIPQDIGQYVIAGKEAFVGKTGPRVIEWLGELRRRRPCVRTGLVTNGTLLHKHHDLVSDASLSHMDISMDGCEPDHDAIRGPGAFAKVRENVEWAAKLLGERLFITLTLQKRNLERIHNALQAFAAMGAKSVGISPFELLPYNDHSLALSPADLRAFFASLSQLDRLDLPHEMFIQADACLVEPQALIAFTESDWFDLDSMQIDGTGFLYCRHHLANGITLSFRYLPWPMTLDSSVRISADGELLSVEDARHPRTYHLNSLANLRDFGFDFGAAFNAAKKHPRLALQDAAFEAKLQPVVHAAYHRRQRQNRPVQVAVPA